MGGGARCDAVDADARRGGRAAHPGGRAAAVSVRSARPPGDQYVVLQIVLPPADTARARELYEALRRELPFDPRAGL